MTSPNPHLVTSYALLAANYEAGQDHIDSLLGFALAAAAELPSATTVGVSPDDVAKQIRMHFGLEMPHAAVTTVLNRAASRKFVRRSMNKYILDEQRVASLDFAGRLSGIDREYAALAKRLMAWTKANLDTPWSLEECEKALNSYADEHGARVLAIGLGLSRSWTENEEAWASVVGEFCHEIVRSDPEAFAWLEKVLKGSLLSSALYFDFGKTSQRFTHLDLYLDTTVLLDLMGVAPVEAKEAAREGLRLLMDVGATPVCFASTLDEISGVLTSIQAHLRLSGKRVKNLRPWPRERVLALVEMGMSPADVEAISGNLPAELRKYGIQLRGRPGRTKQWTLDEIALKAFITEGHILPDERGEDHDVNAIADINELRRGVYSASIDTTTALFVTNNRALAERAAQFMRHQVNDERPFVPPALPWTEVVTLAWLKKPMAYPALPNKMIIAQAYAAVRMPPKLWARYLTKVEEMRIAGSVDEELLVALRSSPYAKKELLRMTGGRLSSFRGDTARKVLDQLDVRTTREVGMAVAAREQSLREQQAQIDAERDMREALDKAEIERLSEVENKAKLLEQNARRLATRIGLVSNVIGWITWAIIAGVIGLLLVLLVVNVLASTLLSAEARKTLSDLDKPLWILGTVLVFFGGSIRGALKVARIWETEHIHRTLCRWVGISPRP